MDSLSELVDSLTPGSVRRMTAYPENPTVSFYEQYYYVKLCHKVLIGHYPVASAARHLNRQV